MDDSAPHPPQSAPPSASLESASTGMSLAELSQAFAAMLGGDDSATVTISAAGTLSAAGVPAAESPPGSRQESPSEKAGSDAPARQSTLEPPPRASELNSAAGVPPAADDSTNLVTPKSILEAALFVGRPDNVPLTSQQIAGLVRGTTADEVDQNIVELNSLYAANNCPYRIISEGAGYRLVLTSDHAELRNRFYGRLRTARLSPAAVEVLALVAYREPLTADEVGRMRGIPSGHILRQLVRRQLLRLESSPTKPRKSNYFTTGRFLEVFGLKSLNDLPRSDDPSRE